ncbi:MAG: hypothetical protein Q9159_001695 [Coniocarpon cinnabarinum]
MEGNAQTEQDLPLPGLAYQSCGGSDRHHVSTPLGTRIKQETDEDVQGLQVRELQGEELRARNDAVRYHSWAQNDEFHESGNEIALSTLGLSGPIATVFVGEGRKERRFDVHELLACRFSGLFRDVFWRESPRDERPRRALGLPAEEPLTFELFVQWLYAQPFYAAWNGSVATTLPLFRHRRLEQIKELAVDDLLLLHGLAQFLKCPLLQACIGVALGTGDGGQTGAEMPRVGEVNFVYESWDAPQEFRHALVARFLHHNPGMNRSANLRPYPRLFWNDCLWELRQQQAREDEGSLRHFVKPPPPPRVDPDKPRSPPPGHPQGQGLPY